MEILTDIGQKRSNNQDFVNKFVNQAGVTLVVKLQMEWGGHWCWNIASEMSVTDLVDWINTDFRELSHQIDDCRHCRKS